MLGDITGESAALIAMKTQYTEDVRTMGWLPKDNSKSRIEEAWDRKQAMCVVDDKTRGMELPKPLDTLNIMNPR